MQEVHTYIRTSHHYNDGWRHLDSSKFLATVKTTPARKTSESEEYDGNIVSVRHCRAPAGVPLQQLMRALRDTMSGSGCQHEYDCCGCFAYRASVKHVGSRHLVIVVVATPNY